MGLAAQSQMRFLCRASTGQEIVENVKASFASRDMRDAAPLEAVIQQFATNQRRNRRGRVILQFIEETSFGGGLSACGFCSGQCIEDEGGQRQSRGKRRRGKGEK